MKFNPGREGLGLQALLKSCLLQDKLTPCFHKNRPSLYQQPSLGVTLGSVPTVQWCYGQRGSQVPSKDLFPLSKELKSIAALCRWKGKQLINGESGDCSKFPASSVPLRNCCLL